MERIQVLDSVEEDILTCLDSAGQVFSELSKEKSRLKQAENHTLMFLKTLSTVESKLTDQINHLAQVSTGQPHQGSSYASQKVYQMAGHRLVLTRCRLKELEKYKIRHIQEETALRSSHVQPGGAQMKNVGDSNIQPGSSN